MARQHATAEGTPGTARSLTHRLRDSWSAWREPAPAAAVTEADLEQALDYQELLVHFQLVVDPTGAPCGAEALVRWQRPGHGIVSAAGFVEAARSLELARRLADVATAETVAALPQLRSFARGTEAYVALNASPLQVQDRMFVARLASQLRAAGVDPAGLVIELTDASAITDWPAIVESGQELRRMGIRLAVDDTGIEPGDLLYRDRCDATFVKLDRSIIAESRRWNHERRVVEATVALCRNAGHPVIAHGVEDEATATWLVGLGVDLLQGYHYGRPEPLEHLVHRVAAVTGPVADGPREERPEPSAVAAPLAERTP